MLLSSEWKTYAIWTEEADSGRVRRRKGREREENVEVVLLLSSEWKTYAIWTEEADSGRVRRKKGRERKESGREFRSSMLLSPEWMLSGTGG